jgi:hypothetical protein
MIHTVEKQQYALVYLFYLVCQRDNRNQGELALTSGKYIST